MTKKEIQKQVVERKLTRADILPFLSQQFGIPEDIISNIFSTRRRLQEAIPNDEKGVMLEKQWRTDRGMASAYEVAQVQIWQSGHLL